MMCEEDTIILGFLETMDEANLTIVLVILTLTQAAPSCKVEFYITLKEICFIAA